MSFSGTVVAFLMATFFLIAPLKVLSESGLTPCMLSRSNWYESSQPEFVACTFSDLPGDRHLEISASETLVA